MSQEREELGDAHEQWAAYSNEELGFSFEHPPSTSVRAAVPYGHEPLAIARYEVLSTNPFGFRETINVYRKLPNQGLSEWYDETIETPPAAYPTGPFPREINGYEAVEVIYPAPGDISRLFFLGQNDLILGVAFGVDRRYDDLSTDEWRFLYSMSFY